MGKDPAMPLYVNDWISSPIVLNMNAEEEISYLRLLMFCWSSGDVSIPTDLKWLSNLTRTSEGVCKRVVELAFVDHPEKEGFLTNNKLWEVWRERRKFNDSKSKAGKASVEAKRQQKETACSASVATERQPSSSSSSSSFKVDIVDSADLGKLDLDEAAADAAQASEHVPTSQPPDRQFVCRAAIAKQIRFGEHWWRESLGAVSACAPDDPVAYFNRVCTERAEKLAQVSESEFTQIISSIKVPRKLYRMLEEIRAGPQNGQPVEIGELLKSAPKE